MVGAGSSTWPSTVRPPLPEQTDVPERLIVSPRRGIFQPRLPGSDADRVVQPGSVVGTVGDVAVESPFVGYLMGFLALPGERVRCSQALAWLRPLDES